MSLWVFLTDKKISLQNSAKNQVPSNQNCSRTEQTTNFVLKLAKHCSRFMNILFKMPLRLDQENLVGTDSEE
jgi:hypothetical protein